MALTELKIAQNRGDAVIALFERAAVAPLPAFYELAYDYVAGVQSLGALRLGDLIDGEQAEPPHEKLYEEFVRPYEMSDAVDAAASQMQERLAALDDMIVERQEVSRAESKSLDDVSKRLAAAPASAALMRDWVTRLLRARDAASGANASLVEELHRTARKLNTVREEMTKLRKDALIDPVSGLANRSGLDRVLSRSVGQARSGKALALAVIDIDHFKRFNDTYGHQIGDAVLQLVARALVASVRVEDVIGRTGGDEFVAVLRDVQSDSAHLTAETMRRAVVESDLTKVLGPDVLGSITASIGVAHYRDGDTIRHLLDRADRCLFEAKRAGRNRVASDVPPGEAVALAG